jgi:hypothetical protein
MSTTRLSTEIVKSVLDRDNCRCRACGIHDPHNIVVDHIMPESLGGNSTLDNLQSLCHFCNTCKGSTIVDSLPVRPAIVGFGDFAEVMDNRENFRIHVAQCRDSMIDNAAKNVREWYYSKVSPQDIKQRIPSLVGTRNVQKVIYAAFRHDMSIFKQFALVK